MSIPVVLRRAVIIASLTMAVPSVLVAQPTFTTGRINIVNGRIVNVGTAPSLTEGRIIIQSEGSEVFSGASNCTRLPHPLPDTRYRFRRPVIAAIQCFAL